MKVTVLVSESDEETRKAYEENFYKILARIILRIAKEKEQQPAG